MESANLLESSLYCCCKCKGLFNTPDDKIKHQINCMGNPLESTCAYFACERKVFLQIFQPEDFLLDGFDHPFLLSKDDSFINHFVKIRVPDIFDPSIFQKTTTQTNQGDVDDANFLIESNINTLEEETEKADGSTFLDSSKQVDPIDPDQIQSIINKNIEYLKNDDIPSLSTRRNKVEPSFSRSPSLPRLFSPIDKHLHLFGDKHLHFFGDGSKSRVHSPFERSTGLFQDGQLGYSSGSFMYSSNPSIPFSCGLSTDLFSSIPPSQEENQPENQPAFPTNIEECPTLRYLDLAKKDPFFGQNPGLAQINSKDPFLINASFNKTVDRPNVSLQKSQITRSCEDLQSSPTLPLQDGNDFNFSSTLDEPTQLDYLDLATLDFITNPNLMSYGIPVVKERTHEKDDDVYSEDNITYHEPSGVRSEAAARLSTISVGDIGDTNSLSAFSRVKKKKKLRLKKSKSDIERRYENIPSQSKSTLTLYPEVREVLGKHSNIKVPEQLNSFQSQIGQAVLENRDSKICRKRKLDTPKEDNGETKVNRKSYESRRIAKSEKHFNVREKLTHLSEEQKDKMKAVLGQTGCIFVKKKRSLSCDEPVVYVNDSQVFGNTGIFSEQSLDRDNKFHPVISNSALFDQQCKTRKLRSVLQLKCQECNFKCRSVVELKNHRAKHAKISEPEILETRHIQPIQDSFIPDSFTEHQKSTEMIQDGTNDLRLKVQVTAHSASNLSSNSLQNLTEASGLDEQPVTSYFMVTSDNSFSRLASIPNISEDSQPVFGESVAISEITKELVSSPQKAISIVPIKITDTSVTLSQSALNENIHKQYFDNSNSAVCSTSDLNKETVMAVETIENISNEYDINCLDKELISPEETGLRYTSQNRMVDKEIHLEAKDKREQEMALINHESGLNALDVNPDEKDVKSTEINVGGENKTLIALPLYQQEQEFDSFSDADTSDQAEVGKDILDDGNQVMCKYEPESSIIKQDQPDYENSGKSEDGKDLNHSNQTKSNNLTIVLHPEEVNVDMTEVREDKGLGNEQDKEKHSKTILENMCFVTDSEALEKSESTLKLSPHVQDSMETNENYVDGNAKDSNKQYETLMHPLSFESVIDVHSESSAFTEQLDCSDKCSSEVTEEQSSKCDPCPGNYWTEYVGSGSSDGITQPQVMPPPNGSKISQNHLNEISRDTSQVTEVELMSVFAKTNQDREIYSLTDEVHNDIKYQQICETRNISEELLVLDKDVPSIRTEDKLVDYLSSKHELHACSSQHNKDMLTEIAKVPPKDTENAEKEEFTFQVIKDLERNNSLDNDNITKEGLESSITVGSNVTENRKTKSVLDSQSVIPNVDTFSIVAMNETTDKLSVPDTGQTTVNPADEVIVKEATDVAEHTEMEVVVDRESSQVFDTDNLVMTGSPKVAEHYAEHSSLDGKIANVHTGQRTSKEDQSTVSKQDVQTTEDKTYEYVLEKNYHKTIKMSPPLKSHVSSKVGIVDKELEDQNDTDDLNTEHLSSYFLNKDVQGPGAKKQIKGPDGFFHCDVKGCKFKTLYKSNVSPHYQQVHLALKRFICDQCAYSTPNMSCLKHHMQLNHYKQKRFKCPDCDYLSLFHSDVVKHVRHTHMKQKQYACNQCEYRTGHSHSLKLHIMSHSGIRPYKCNSCEYRANNANKVTRHIKLCHANQVGVACEKQDLTFEIDAKQFQCEEIISYQDIKVIELTTEEVNAIMKQKDEKKEQDKKAKVAEKKAKEAERRARKEMKRAAEVADISNINFNNKLPNTNDVCIKDIKVIKLTPEAAKAFMEAKVSKKLTTGKLEETTKYTKMLQKRKLSVGQDIKLAGFTPHEVSELRQETGQKEVDKIKGNTEDCENRNDGRKSNIIRMGATNVTNE